MSVEMRELQADDIFKVLNIVDVLGVADQIVDVFKIREEVSDLTAKAMGYKIILEKNPESKEAKKAAKELEKVEGALNSQSFSVIASITKIVLANMGNAKNEINLLLADLTNSKLDDINKMSMLSYIKLVKSFFEKPELKELSQLFTPSANSEKTVQKEETPSNSEKE